MDPKYCKHLMPRCVLFWIYGCLRRFEQNEIVENCSNMHYTRRQIYISFNCLTFYVFDNFYNYNFFSVAAMK